MECFYYPPQEFTSILHQLPCLKEEPMHLNAENFLLFLNSFVYQYLQ